MYVDGTVHHMFPQQVVRALANLALEHPSQNEIREQGAIPFILPLLKQASCCFHPSSSGCHRC